MSRLQPVAPGYHSERHKMRGNHRTSVAITSIAGLDMYVSTKLPISPHNKHVH